jgi:phage-related protein
MYDIVLYEDARGNSPVQDLLDELDSKAQYEKNARIQLRQIMFYLEILKGSGTRIGEPYTKHIKEEIWELRPGHNRILFFAWKGDTFILLHAFRKTSRKTPPCEIEKADREKQDWVSRIGD